MHPAISSHQAAAGGINTFKAEQLIVATHAPQPCPFTMPPVQMLPEDTTWDSALQEAPCWWTSSGHLLLQPTINGQQVGWMLLDTGTILRWSGLALSS